MEQTNYVSLAAFCNAAVDRLPDGVGEVMRIPEGSEYVIFLATEWADYQSWYRVQDSWRSINLPRVLVIDDLQVCVPTAELDMFCARLIAEALSGGVGLPN